MDRIGRAVELTARGRRPARGSAKQRVAIDYNQTRRVFLSRDKLRDNRILTEDSEPEVKDAYRLLRTRVLHRMRQNGWRTLGVTSASPSEGKSLTSINLAVSIALEVEHTALLVDADLRRPTVHQYLGIPPEVGLSDCLRGAPVRDALVNPSLRNFVVLPGRRDDSVGSEYALSARMTEMVQELRGRYADRVVLFDLSPILVGDDALALARQLDALLIVVEEGSTDVRALSHGIELLEDVEVLGTVLNKARTARNNPYDYYYHY